MPTIVADGTDTTGAGRQNNSLAPTTSLTRWFAQHPDVFMPEVKVPFHFATDLDMINKRQFRDLEPTLVSFLQQRCSAASVSPRPSTLIRNVRHLRSKTSTLGHASLSCSVPRPLPMAEMIRKRAEMQRP
jgi:hypothetical protein